MTPMTRRSPSPNLHTQQRRKGSKMNDIHDPEHWIAVRADLIKIRAGMADLAKSTLPGFRESFSKSIAELDALIATGERLIIQLRADAATSKALH